LRKSALFVLLLWLAVFGLAENRPAKTGKTTPPAKSTALSKPKRASPKKTVASKKSSKRGKKSASRKRHTPSWRRGQQVPTPERHREIQQALLGHGYLQAAPTGVWGEESVDALRRFQQDQHLEPTGKLDSLSLIALGLGPKRGPSGQDGRQPPPVQEDDDDHRSAEGSQRP
jgi:peptidoglycan hydrolase-like protein with peptidoglycan-binding domain